MIDSRVDTAECKRLITSRVVACKVRTLSTNQKVGSSNLSGRTIFPIEMSVPTSRLGSACARAVGGDLDEEQTDRIQKTLSEEVQPAVSVGECSDSARQWAGEYCLFREGQGHELFLRQSELRQSEDVQHDLDFVRGQVEEHRRVDRCNWKR